MKKYFYGLLLVFYNMIRFVLIKITRLRKFIKVKFIQFFSISTHFDIEGKEPKISIGAKNRSRDKFKIRVRNGNLTIGNNNFFNDFCSINCHYEITIGNNCAFGPNVQLYDHDHNVVIGSKEKYVYGSITIGSNVWIGANTVILKDSHIGDNAIIAAGSVVKGTVPEDSIFLQKRQNILKKRVTL